ncbi:hydrolase [Cochleicola gelatinilyticus]|uniref:Hydrolase n=2 Tax=Cochleicola gelatinilyticus TaxID=1763537 RepID=A0A167H6V5_9FLAO|nr:hydrolase [Cochleicola gelatinilyticus]
MKQIKNIVLICFIAVISLIAILYTMQEKLIFFPVKLPIDYVYTFETPFKEFYITSEDGAKLNGLHFKAENSKGLILYYHGNADNLVRWGKIIEPFVTEGYDVIVMDYRTFGKSTGVLNENKLYEDAELFYTYAQDHSDEKDITVFGRSLGTTFATYVASKNNPKNLILETPFYSLLDVAERRFPIVPMDLILNYKFPTYTFVSKVNCPVLILHGTKDRVVPYESAKALLEEFDAKNSTFITIEGGGHKNLIKFRKYRDNLSMWL